VQGVKDERAFDPEKAREQAEILYNAGIYKTILIFYC
jgi:hypothetical protein